MSSASIRTRKTKSDAQIRAENEAKREAAGLNDHKRTTPHVTERIDKPTGDYDLFDLVGKSWGGGQSGDTYIDPVKNRAYYAPETPATGVQGASDVGTGYPGLYPQYGPTGGAANALPGLTGTGTGNVPGVGAGSVPAGMEGYKAQLDTIMQGLANYGEYAYDTPRPTEDWDRARTIQEQIENREPFSYDYQTDPLWGMYKQAYTREGMRAQEDALGQYAAMTGGMPSSAAIAAAQQQRNYYNAQMADKIPELQQLAYNMYLGDLQQQRADVNARIGMAETANNWWNQDRNFDYGTWTDRYGRQYDLAGLYGDLYRDERDYTHQLEREAINDARYADETAYSRGRDAINDARYDREWDYGVSQDEYNRAWNEEERDYNRTQAEQAAANEAAQQDWNNRYKLAVLAAENGDYRLLQAMGIDPDTDAALQMALAQAGRTVPIGSSYSGGSGSGSSRSGSYSYSGEPDYSGLFTAAMSSQSPENYIASHYKEYGFTKSTGLSGAFKTWKEEQAQKQQNRQSKYTEMLSTGWSPKTKTGSNSTTSKGSNDELPVSNRYDAKSQSWYIDGYGWATFDQIYGTKTERGLISKGVVEEIGDPYTQKVYFRLTNGIGVQ